MPVLAAASTALAALASYVPYTTDSGVPLRWPTEDLLEVHAAGDPGGLITHTVVRDVLVTALAGWLDTPCPDTTRVDIRPEAQVVIADGVEDEEDGVVSLVWISDVDAWNQRFGANNLAITLVVHSQVSGLIVDADILVNEGRFDFVAPADGCDPLHFDFASMATHELGHVLGLDHTPVETATMAPKSDVGECDKRTLDPDDLAGVCATYSAPARPEPEPEPVPEPTPELAAEAEASGGREDDGCGAGGAGGDVAALALSALVLLSCARRASGGCRRSRRPSPARS